MSKLQLPNVTLLGIDCVNIERLQAAMDVSEREIDFGAVKLLSSLSTEDNRLVKIPHISSVEDFSVFCIKELNKYVETDYVLLVQYDGFILTPNSWTPEFLEYDYIGAPCSGGMWSVKDPNIKSSSLVVGNGGFCLRSKKFLEVSAKLANEEKINKFHPEDISLCVWNRYLIEKEGVKFAPVDLAIKFSVVEDYGVYDKPFGFHGFFGKNMDYLINNYPNFPIHFFLPKIRDKRINKIKEVFDSVAIESHVLKNCTESNPDSWGNINAQLTFKKEDIAEILDKRSEYYSKIGDIVEIKEPSESISLNGIKSFVVYKTKVGLLKVNFYLCQQEPE